VAFRFTAFICGALSCDGQLATLMSARPAAGDAATMPS
jgi:hypothetical protein